MLRDSFRDLTRFERILWGCSLIVVTASFLLAPAHDWLTLCASLIGVTALIFVSKGYVLGQALTVVFALFYGVISFFFHYYGEMITYLCMTAPVAAFSVISWLRHPYKGSREVEVTHLNGRIWALALALTAAVTVVFWFILQALGNANLTMSTLSVTTSFLASFLAFLRSPYYALAYSANDVVLIILWILATIEDPAYLPMILCFTMFLVNDLYGFVNWRRLRRVQGE